METDNNIMLTTVDNPYNPFDDFDRWLEYDISKGYNTNGLLSRIVDELQLKDKNISEDEAIALAMEQIVNENVSGLHKLVTKE